jgi:Xaa-Pro aminopeptidase
MFSEISKKEYKDRIRKIQKILQEKDIDVLVTFGSESEPQNLIYLSNYWPAFETACVVVPVEGDPILVIGPESKTFAMDYTKIDKIRQVLEHRESSEPNYPGIKLSTYEEIFDEALNGRAIKKIAFSGLTITTLPVYEAIRKAAGRGEILKADDIMIQLRMIKSQNEIALMKKSAEITMKSFEAVKNNVKAGMEEVEVAGYAVGEMFKSKAENLAYTPYLLSGKRTNQAIGRASHKTIKKNEPLQFSCGCRYGNYSSSIGRPFCIGKMPDDYKSLVKMGIELQKVVIGTLKAGIPASTVFRKYWEHLEKAGFSRFFLYGPCHGTGIMECEHPFLESDSDYTLIDGMTFQVDIFLGDSDYGMRFEDGVVIREDGVEEFTSSYREIIEL